VINQNNKFHPHWLLVDWCSGVFVVLKKDIFEYEHNDYISAMQL